MRGLLLLLEAGLVSLAPACAAWPLGAHLDAASSGLLGEWAAPPTSGSRDTVIWLFRATGRYEILRATPGPRTDQSDRLLSVTHGRWEVYRDAEGGPGRLVCFDRRGRGWPSCRSFKVDSAVARVGQTHRVLTWDGWMGEKPGAPVALTERVPDPGQLP